MTHGSIARSKPRPYTLNAVAKYRTEARRHRRKRHRFLSREQGRYPDDVIITDAAETPPAIGRQHPVGRARRRLFASWDKCKRRPPSLASARQAAPPRPARHRRANAEQITARLRPRPASSCRRRIGDGGERRPRCERRRRRSAGTGEARARRTCSRAPAAPEELKFTAAICRGPSRRPARWARRPRHREDDGTTRKTAAAAAAAAAAPRRRNGHVAELSVSAVTMIHLDCSSFSGVKPPAPRKSGRGSFGWHLRRRKASPGKTTTCEFDAQRYARGKLGMQKGISSDEFFGRAASTVGPGRRTRHQGLDGAISSNASLGRPSLPPTTLRRRSAPRAVRGFGPPGADAHHGRGANRLQSAVKAYLGKVASDDGYYCLGYGLLFIFSRLQRSCIRNGTDGLVENFASKCSMYRGGSRIF